MGDQGETVAHSNDEFAFRLCELAGIDPGQTTSISLQAYAGMGAVITWEGVKRVSFSDVAKALAPDDPGPAPARCNYVATAAGVRCLRDQGHDGDHVFATVKPDAFHGET